MNIEDSADPLGDWLSGKLQAPVPRSVPYEILSRKHPEYNAEYWARCRALRAGGRTLLGNEGVMASVLPKFEAESQEIYQDRLQRAAYAPHAGTVVESLLAGLFADPLTVEGGSEFFAAFQADCSPPGGTRQPLNELLREAVETAFCCEGTACVLVDLPQRPENVVSRADAGRLGLDRPFAYVLAPERLINWQDNANGELDWAMVWSEEPIRPNPFVRNPMCLERWTYYTPTSWFVYEHQRSVADRKIDPGTNVRLVASGEHSFGRVPIRRLRLTRALRVMDKLESLARAHLNADNGLQRAMLRSLFPVLYEFQADAVTTDTEKRKPSILDPNRSVNQTRGPGYAQIRQEKDRAEFIGPSAAPFEQARQICEDIERQIYATVHSMALNSDPKSAAAIGRSGESKQADRAAQAIVLRALGQQVRAFVLDLLETVAYGRGDRPAPTFKLNGLEKFDQMNATDAITEASALQMVNIPSPTFQTEFHCQVAEMVLGEKATPEIMANIRQELQGNHAHEVGASVPPSSAQFSDLLPDEQPGVA